MKLALHRWLHKMEFESYLETASLKRTGNYRELRLREDLLDFSSNDYLGMADDPEIRSQLIWELQHGCGLGSTGSRLISGNTAAHAAAESTLAKLFGFDSALIFSSGFAANTGVLSAFRGPDVCFFSDELNHASLIDGMRLSGSPKKVYLHLDMKNLEEKLATCESPLKVIVSESVFSMDGDLAPLAELLAIAAKHRALLIIDEAHATGVFGETGLGLLPNSDHKVISIHTGGKALGAQGAFVLSSHRVREYLVNKSRSFIYSTAVSPLSARHLEIAMLKVSKAKNERRHLIKLVERVRSGLGLALQESQIIPLVLGSNELVLATEERLRLAGFSVKAIRSPTVKVGSERLRVTLKSFHTEEQVADLIKIIRVSL